VAVEIKRAGKPRYVDRASKFVADDLARAYLGKTRGKKRVGAVYREFEQWIGDDSDRREWASRLCAQTKGAMIQLGYTTCIPVLYEPQKNGDIQPYPYADIGPEMRIALNPAWATELSRILDSHGTQGVVSQDPKADVEIDVELLPAFRFADPATK
jgi:hypothetical protein